MTKLIFFAFVLVCASSTVMAQKETAVTLKSILLGQLKTTHTEKNWFVPVNIALEDLTPDQANWTDGKGNHSVAQLATHLIFWNERLLKQFNGEEPSKYDGINDETFAKVDKTSWKETVAKIDKILSQWEKAIDSADEAKLSKWYENIANMSTHNAYHTGQIIYIRKLQGSWDPNKGVR